MRERRVLYIHGKGGSAEESASFAPLFPGQAVTGLDYRASTPWEAGREIRGAVEGLYARAGRITLIANSIGAYFAMCAGIDSLVLRAYFISPVVDMERLILGMMARVGVTEAELRAKGRIPVAGGDDLSWEYLRYVREHPLQWAASTEILYGSRDDLTPREAVAAFASAHGAGLTVMEGGEHWFHTEEQLRFLADWLTKLEAGDGQCDAADTCLNGGDG